MKCFLCDNEVPIAVRETLCMECFAEEFMEENKSLMEALAKSEEEEKKN